MKQLLVSLILLLSAAGLAAEPEAQEQETIHILFLGNSFTYRHNLTELVKAVFEEGNPGLTVQVRQVVYGGQNMFTHWTYFQSQTILEMSTVTDETIKERIARIKEIQALDDLPAAYVAYPETLGKKIKMPGVENFSNALGWALKQHEQLLTHNPRTKWDYVVLQSWVDEHADPDMGYAKWAMNFVELAEQHGTQVVLYITAPFVQNAKPVEAPQLPGQVELQLKVARQLADKIDAFAVVPVPLAINMIQQGGTDLTFCYVKDFHPNQTTAFLTANMFYAAMFNKSPEGFSFDTVTDNRSDDHGKDADGGDAKVVFEGETKTYLQKMAFEAVQAFDLSLESESAPRDQ